LNCYVHRWPLATLAMYTVVNLSFYWQYFTKKWNEKLRNKMILDVFDGQKWEKLKIFFWPYFYIWFSMCSQKYKRMITFSTPSYGWSPLWFQTKEILQKYWPWPLSLQNLKYSPTPWIWKRVWLPSSIVSKVYAKIIIWHIYIYILFYFIF